MKQENAPIPNAKRERQGPPVCFPTMAYPPVTPPDAIVRLPATFNNYQQALAMIGQEVPSRQDAARTVTPEGVLNAIGSRTGTFMGPSHLGDRSVHIWGDPERVIAARNILETLIMRCEKEPVTRKAGRWVKAHPHWEDREAYERTRKSQEAMLRTLKREPEKLDPGSEILTFEWYSEDLTMVQALGEELEKLDSIRMRFKVHVYPSPDVENRICVAGYQKADAETILACLRQSSQEAIAKFDTRIMAYMIEPPSYDARTNIVSIKKYSHGAESSLQKVPFSAESEVLWADESQRIKEANIELLLSSLETSLSKCHYVKGDMRMRVHFGSFVLDTFQRPKPGLHGQSFEQFRKMLAADQAKGRLLPRLHIGWEKLLERCSKASDFLEPMNTGKPLGSIGSMQPNYSASFEFAEPHSRLRLETYFKTVPGSCEIEVAGHRWFELRRNREDKRRQMTMQMGMLDFERCDWQIDLEHFEPLDAGTINLRAELESFAAAVAFNSGLTFEQCGFSAPPVKKILFPPQPSVSRYIEKGALQFKIKGTSYILELIRFDEYKPMPSAQREVSMRHSATWAATLFNPQWAIELESKNPGESIEAFFPSSSGVKAGSREGFWEFLMIVRKVADLLGCPRTEKDGSELLQADFGTLF